MKSLTLAITMVLTMALLFFVVWKITGVPRSDIKPTTTQKTVVVLICGLAGFVSATAFCWAYTSLVGWLR